MTPLRNGEIADLFDLLGDLYELDGAVVYRVLAYRRAAKRFRETAESVWSLSEQGRLTDWARRTWPPGATQVGGEAHPAD